MNDLPIDEILPELKATLTEQANLVLVAPPGAGITTRVPLALLDNNVEYLDQLWSRLSQAQPAKQDSLGASLRLIAMMSVSGTLWSD